MRTSEVSPLEEIFKISHPAAGVISDIRDPYYKEYAISTN